MRAIPYGTQKEYEKLISTICETAILAAELGKKKLFTSLLSRIPLKNKEEVMTSLLTTAELDLNFILWVNGLDINTMTHKSVNVVQTGSLDTLEEFISGLSKEDLLKALSAEDLPHNSVGVAQPAMPADSSYFSSSSSLSTRTTSTAQAVVVQSERAGAHQGHARSGEVNTGSIQTKF